jgi:glycosyltransferase involved in cell wall biosynthesis
MTQIEPLRARAAIVHDWFPGYHGSERVADVMRMDVFDEAAAPDVFTFVAARDRLPPELAAAIVQESALARLPGLRPGRHDRGRWRYLLPLMPRYFRHLDLDSYDVVISSSHACAVHARPRRDAVYVCYCHTPMRYVWLPDIEEGRVTGVVRRPLEILTGRLRRSDLAASRRPDVYIANSRAVRERIRRFYGREAAVVHPPVEVEEFSGVVEKDPEEFLWVHRLVSYKRPALVVEAFAELPYRLTMVGIGPLETDLRRRLPPNVQLRPWVDRHELVSLFKRSAGFIHIGEEDFGISMVEALASATPVVALARGGALDIVRDGVDGVLVDRPEVEALRRAVRHVATHAWDRAALVERSRVFSRARFAEQMRLQVAELIAARRKSFDA